MTNSPLYPGREILVFIPGFFGFGSFGPSDSPLIEYFRFARTVIQATRAVDLPVIVHQPPPTGPLSLRAASLHRTLQRLLTEGHEDIPVSKIHLVGHSSGGVDARLVTNTRYRWTGGPDSASRAQLLKQIGSVITLAAPLRGTPLAQNLRPGMELAIPALWLASILASRHALSLAGHVGLIVEAIEEFVIRRTTPEAELIAKLANVDAQTARDIRRFLDEVIRDHRLVGDLTPHAMTELDRAITGADHPRLHSLVTVAPKPSRSLTAALALARDPLRSALYRLVHSLTRGAPPTAARWPSGPWIGPRPAGLRTDAHDASDGIVPTWSQTLKGHAAAIVSADHLDVIGFYKGAGVTFLRSESRFDDAQFRALWTRIAELIDP
ncbi:MAG: hypothetical protein Q8Q09_19315 [Deltaproteobacteria bacterium]|nr:hypothetical protein [Deltaproteobacteria bacterium]